MKWLINWILSFRPWVVTVSKDGGKPEVFGEYWRESEARLVYEMSKDHIPFNDDAPVATYQLLTRAEWNKRKAS